MHHRQVNSEHNKLERGSGVDQFIWWQPRKDKATEHDYRHIESCFELETVRYQSTAKKNWSVPETVAAGAVPRDEGDAGGDRRHERDEYSYGVEFGKWRKFYG